MTVYENYDVFAFKSCIQNTSPKQMSSSPLIHQFLDNGYVLQRSQN